MHTHTLFFSYNLSSIITGRCLLSKWLWENRWKLTGAKALGWCSRTLLTNLHCPQASRCPSLAPSHKNSTKAPRDLAATWPADGHQSFLSKQIQLSFHLSWQSGPRGPPLPLLQPFLRALQAAGGLGASAFNLTGLGAPGSAPPGQRPASRRLRG